MFGFFKRRRRERWRALPPPPGWEPILRKNVPLLASLPDADRRELLGHVQVFLAEKRFEGCGGQGITDEVRLTIAAQACLLLLHRESDYFPTVSSVLVYPTAYKVKNVEHHLDGRVTEEEDVNTGEAWPQDMLVLSWEDVLAGALEEGAPNVVLHEFAHALDDEDGESNGAPPLPDRARLAEWSRVMTEAYDRLCADADRGRETVLDAYGAESPAEFFAVATEAFFQYPADLRDAEPKLYQILQAYYRQEPAAW